MIDTEVQFLLQSNYIEEEYSLRALRDAISAWLCLTKKGETTVELILASHKLLMKNLNTEVAGQLRHYAVSIGGKVKPALGVSVLKHELSQWIARWYTRPGLSQEDIKRSHVEFEDIHPFGDGNGRIGRMLFNKLRLNNGYPLLVINACDRYDYYRWFDNSNEVNDFVEDYKVLLASMARS